MSEDAWILRGYRACASHSGNDMGGFDDGVVGCRFRRAALGVLRDRRFRDTESREKASIVDEVLRWAVEIARVVVEPDECHSCAVSVVVSTLGSIHRTRGRSGVLSNQREIDKNE